MYSNAIVYFILTFALGCYPFQDRDPFVLPETPHVFFAGNQNKYETRLLTGTNFDILPHLQSLGDDGQKCRIVLVPKFKETGIMVLVNLSTLESTPIAFKTS